MKAVVYTQYGLPEVLQLKDVEQPVPKDNEVLIRIHATTVTAGDCMLRSLSVPLLLKLPLRLWLGFRKPKREILGVDLSGEVITVGKDVTLFKQGDSVFGSAFDYGFGTYAQYTCMSEDSVLAIKPNNLTHEESAAIFFGANAALYFLRKGKIKSGQKVLVYGASGAVGVYAVQLAKYFGAEVTGVCSTSNVELVKSIGADRVIDYTREDFTKSGETYDIVFDTVGKSPFAGSVKSLNEHGVYLKTVHMTPVPILRGLWVSLTSNKKVVGGTANETVDDLIFLRALLETEIIKPVIDRYYPLEGIVEAHRYVEKGHKKGSVVVTVGHAG